MLEVHPKPPLLHPTSRGKRYGRDGDELALDLAWAIAEHHRNDVPILETLEAGARARWT